jgi:hypothetical protein
MKGLKVLKRVAFVCGNVGVVMWSCILVLEGMSLTKGFSILIGSLFFINLLFWNAFRLREKSDAELRVTMEAEIRKKIAQEQQEKLAGGQ